MTLEEYDAKTTAWKIESEAKDYLEFKKIDLFRFNDICNYWWQEKGINNNQNEEVLDEALKRLENFIFKEYISDGEYEKIRESLEIYLGYMKRKMRLLGEVKLESWVTYDWEKKINYFKKVQSRLDYTFKSFFQEVLKELGAPEGLNNEVLLRELWGIFSSLGISSLGRIFYEVSDDKEKLEELKQTFKKLLKQYIRIEDKEFEEVLRVGTIINNELLGIKEENIERYFQNCFNFNSENEMGSWTFKYDKKYKTMSVIGKNRYYDLEDRKYYISGCDTVSFYDREGVMQGYYEFYVSDWNDKIDWSRRDRVVKEKRLVKGFNGMARFTLITLGDVIIDTEIDEVYEEHLVEGLSFREYHLNPGLREYVYFDYDEMMERKLMLYLSQNGIRYMVLANDERISMGAKDFSEEKMFRVMQDLETEYYQGRNRGRK